MDTKPNLAGERLAALDLGRVALSPLADVAVVLSGVLSFYTILRRLDRMTAWALTAGIGVLLFAAVAAAAYLRSSPSYLYSGGVMVIAVLGVLVTTALLADVRRSRTEIKEVKADNLETLREQAAMAERARIAREMHDIVAHSISMVAVQAETSPTRSPVSTSGPSRSSPRSR